ncbi:MAG: beta-lactamase family protein [Defluviitaleaceae bacterium]|nr:beta-lactamase family protein [Defluviitaleaceae bacterium]
MAERMRHFNVPGVSVCYFDEFEIQWVKCFGTLEAGTDKAVTEDSIFHACSISKMITSLCVLRLVRNGDLDLYKDVNEYLVSWKIPDNGFTKERKITLAHLLSHQAGFYDCDGSFAPYKKGEGIPKPIDILMGTTRYNPEEVKAVYVPGTDCNYSDAGYCVIAQILEDVFGESIPQIAERLVFEPLGLSRTFFWEIGKDKHEGINASECAAGHDKNGEIVEEIRACYPNTEGAALWTTPSDLALITIDIIKSYQGSSGNILSHDMGKLMLTPFGCDENAGMGVFLENDSYGSPYFFSQGWGVGMQCKLRAYYKNKNGVIVMTNSEPGMEQDESLVGEIIEYVCKNHVI